MIIRLADYYDAEQIANNNILLAKESENIKISNYTVLAGVKELLKDSLKGFYVVALEENEIIGQLMVTFEWSDWRNTNIWWLQSVYVKKDYRRKGIFKHLIKEIKKMAKKNNIQIIRLYVYNKNIAAKEVYKKVKMEKKSYEIFELSIEK